MGHNCSKTKWKNGEIVGRSINSYNVIFTFWKTFANKVRIQRRVIDAFYRVKRNIRLVRSWCWHHRSIVWGNSRDQRSRFGHSQQVSFSKHVLFTYRTEKFAAQQPTIDTFQMINCRKKEQSSEKTFSSNSIRVLLNCENNKERELFRFEQTNPNRLNNCPIARFRRISSSAIFSAANATVSELDYFATAKRFWWTENWKQRSNKTFSLRVFLT